jgi:hypothetical protein
MIHIRISEEKLAELIRLLDRNQSPEACAMLLDADFVHVPDDEMKKRFARDRIFGN